MLQSGPMEPAEPQHGEDRSRLLGALLHHGVDVVSFQALEDGVRVFQDDGALVAYVDTGSAWLAIGRPLTEPASVARAAASFVAAARGEGRRVSFVGVEARELLPEHRAYVLGEQPIFVPSDWPQTLAGKKSLREQLRRAKAKGVRVRRVAPDELVRGSSLRMRVRELAVAWLTSRRMEPLQFLVALEPFHAPEHHRYFVAERDGRVIAFASAVPVPGREGFLLEDVLRDDDVPNGTTELLFDAVIREVADARLLTPGLAPLSGEVAPILRAMRSLTRPLYDFQGLQAFKTRLQPARWEPVYLVLPKGENVVLHFLECFRAFAGGSLLRFAARSLVRHPSGPPWALVVPLICWIALRLGVAALGRAAHFAASPIAVVAWSMLDVVLAGLLFRAALRPTAQRLALATLVALLVALRSSVHVALAGFGALGLDATLRAIMVLAPTFGTFALAWATHRRRALERGEHEDFALPHF